MLKSSKLITVLFCLASLLSLLLGGFYTGFRRTTSKPAQVKESASLTVSPDKSVTSEVTQPLSSLSANAILNLSDSLNLGIEENDLPEYVTNYNGQVISIHCIGEFSNWIFFMSSSDSITGFVSDSKLSLEGTGLRFSESKFDDEGRYLYIPLSPSGTRSV